NTFRADKSGAVTVLQSGVGCADNYANRFSGFFVPPTTGDYVFFVCSDDDSDLFLSTDDKPANKRMIAQETNWSDTLRWVSSLGNTPLGQKRSDQFSPDGGVTFPFATGIRLVAGTHYYIEGVHHEGTGGDNFAATYNMYGELDPVDLDPPKLTGNVIGVNVPAPTTLTITSQPQNTTVFAGTPAQFTIAV